MLESAIQHNPAVEYFHSSRIYIDDDGRQIRARQAREWASLQEFTRRGPVKSLHCFKVQAALAIGGMDETLGPHAADDYDFSWCMAEAGARFQAIPEYLYAVRDHRRHARLTTHVPLDTQVSELVKILRKHRMTDEAIHAEVRRRTAGYMRQALYLSDADKQAKERNGYDIRSGWREG